MNLSDFLRIYPLRSPNIMWFLGAGASLASGIPTATDMIWDFKRTLYCSAQRISVRTCPDLNNPQLRAKLQQYFDSLGGYPSRDSADEYAFYFERTYPSAGDRRRYIDRMLLDATPSYGHLCLAALLKLDKARAVWTTNFDRMIEDAAIPLLGTSGRLVVASIDSAQLALEALNEGRWPLLAKIHGDFQSQRLKNTTTELKEQDARLRHALVEAGKRYGLAVSGYSGRDQSVMDALEEAIDGGRGYPTGLFWFVRPGSSILPSVTSLISRAFASGIEAHIIEAETFDELLADVLLLIPDLPDEVTEYLNRQPRRVSDAPLPPTRGSWPVIRLNALPVISAPTVCRRLVCSIGGTGEVQEAVRAAGAQVLAARRSVGVIAFGRDCEIRKAFDPYGIAEYDLHSIEPRRMYYDSAELGLYSGPRNLDNAGGLKT